MIICAGFILLQRCSNWFTLARRCQNCRQVLIAPQVSWKSPREGTVCSIRATLQAPERPSSPREARELSVPIEQEATSKSLVGLGTRKQNGTSTSQQNRQRLRSQAVTSIRFLNGSAPAHRLVETDLQRKLFIILFQKLHGMGQSCQMNYLSRLLKKTNENKPKQKTQRQQKKKPKPRKQKTLEEVVKCH